MDVDTAIEQLRDELVPSFFEGLEKKGWSMFDQSRIRDIERQVTNLDHLPYVWSDLQAELEDKYDCSIEHNQYDGVTVLHNDWEFDDMGNCTKKVVIT